MPDLLLQAIDSINASLKGKYAISPSEVKLFDIKSFVSTGVTPLDSIMTYRDEHNQVLGRGIAFPGKVIGIAGDESVGKSTLETLMRTSVQKAGGFTVHVDSESGFYLPRALRMGYNPDLNLELEADTLEQAFSAIETSLKELREPRSDPDKPRGPKISAISMDRPILYVLDTVSNLPAQDDKSSEYSGGMAKGPRVVHSFCRNIPNLLSRNNANLVIIAQQMDSLNSYGNPIAPAYQGRGFKFLGHCLLQIKGGQVFGGVEGDGKKVTIKINKCKLFRPHGEVELSLFFNQGFVDSKSTLGNLFDLGLTDPKRGGNTKYYKINGVDLIPFGGDLNNEGKMDWDKMIEIYDSNPEFRGLIQNRLHSQINW